MVVPGQTKRTAFRSPVSKSVRTLSRSMSVKFLKQVGVESLCLPSKKSISTGNPPAVIQQSVHSEELGEEVGRCLEGAIDDKVGGAGEGFKGVFSSKDAGGSAEEERSGSVDVEGMRRQWRRMRQWGREHDAGEEDVV